MSETILYTNVHIVRHVVLYHSGEEYAYCIIYRSGEIMHIMYHRGTDRTGCMLLVPVF